MDDGRERYQRSVESALTELREQLALYEPVIEAAKAFYAERQEPDSGHSVEELTFWQSVRALLAAEGEG